MGIISVVIGNFITLICLILILKYFKNKVSDAKISLKIDNESKDFIESLGKAIADNLKENDN